MSQPEDAALPPSTRQSQRKAKRSAPLSVATAWKLASAMLGTLCLVLCVLTVMLLTGSGSSGAQGAGLGNPSGTGSNETASGTTEASAALGPAIAFVKKDDQRGGNWRSDLGKDGYMIFSGNATNNHIQKLPAYIESIETDGAHYLWAHNNDKRGLENPTDKGPRISACVYSDSEMNFNIAAKRPVPYKLSIYCLDADRLGRTQRMEFSSEGKPLHSIELPGALEGFWLTYTVRGSLNIKVSCTGPANAVVAAFFFDEGQDRVPSRRVPPESIPASADNLKEGVIAELFEGLAVYAHAENKPTIRIVLPTLKLGSTPALNAGQGLRNWPFSGALAAIYSGFVQIEQEGAYTFFIESDDGSKLYVNGTLLVDNDGPHPMKEASGAIALTPGLHRIFIEYFNAGGSYGFNAHMQRQGGPKEPLAAQLRYDPAE